MHTGVWFRWQLQCCCERPRCGRLTQMSLSMDQSWLPSWRVGRFNSRRVASLPRIHGPPSPWHLTPSTHLVIAALEFLPYIGYLFVSWSFGTQ
jgi:hypothetical protein